MTKLKIFIATLALVALAASPATKSAAGPPEARQWQVKNSSTVEVGIPYELHNTRRRQLDLGSQLGYKKFKISRKDEERVGWVGHSGGLFEFRRANPRDHRSIKPDETLALYNTLSREYMLGSLNELLLWSSSPSYEWMVHDREGADFALYNTKTRDYFVLGNRFPRQPVNEGLTWLKLLSQ